MTGSADIVIVGAGSAGAVLAARLSENPSLRVCLVEAGTEPDDPRVADPSCWPALQGGPLDWTFETVAQPGTGGRPHAWPRGRAVGGTTVINAMGHMRGHPGDFDAWHAAGATGWDWPALRPYFIRSETSPFAPEDGYGGAGPLHLSQPDPPHGLSLAHRAAGIECGLIPIRDHNGPQMHGPTLNTMTIHNGCRQTVADAYLTTKVRARANLHIVTGHLIDRIQFDNSGKACGVLALRNGHVVSLPARTGVILCAGTIGSPMILMRSGIGRAAHLAEFGIAPRYDLPGVGRNLQDHLLGFGNLYRARQEVPNTTTQHSESLCYTHAAGQPITEPPDLVVGVVTLPAVSDGLDVRSDLPEPGRGYTLMFGITHPKSRGCLRLTAADPLAAPEIDPAYLSHPRDMAQCLEALEWTRRLGWARAYDDWRAAEILPAEADLETDAARRAFVRAAVMTHHHPTGTCRMGRDDHAVTAPDLAVRGCEGLFIVDGSILPTLTTGPVNAAIIAVAERGASLISARLG